MHTVRHGLSIGIEHSGNEFFMRMKIAGKLTHEDYEIITPMLEAAIAGIKQPKIKALLDATELEGWELKAAWDDLKLGLKHGNEFTKMAVVGSSRWMKYATVVGSWFVSGEAKYFEDMDEAMEWLC